MHTARKILVSLVAIALVAASLPARADVSAEEHDVIFLADLGTARPLGAIATVAGFFVFVVTSPLAVVTNSVEKSWKTLVLNPANFTFRRELGGEDYNTLDGQVSKPANE